MRAAYYIAIAATILVPSALAILLSCSEESPLQKTTMAEKKPDLNEKLPRCTTLAECTKLNGKRVEIVGTYVEMTLNSPTKKPQIRLRGIKLGDHYILLKAFWAKRRNAKLEGHMFGKKVRVRGTFHTEYPNEPGTNKQTSGPITPTTQPVESVKEEP